MRAWVVVLGLASCGRVGFSERDAVGDASGDASDAAPDAPACRDSDGLCPPGCLGMDDDCVATCGDGICSGNAGEKCASCAADCNTAADVCGNGICDADETSASCMTDCGPSPWKSADAAMESDLLAKLNAARTSGVTCPGDSAATVSPPFVAGTSSNAIARDLAWEIAHQPFFPAATMTCNGTSYGTLSNAAGYGAGVYGSGYGSADQATASFTGDASVCPVIMSASYTTVSIGIATDLSSGWVVFMH